MSSEFLDRRRRRCCSWRSRPFLISSLERSFVVTDAEVKNSAVQQVHSLKSKWDWPIDSPLLYRVRFICSESGWNRRWAITRCSESGRLLRLGSAVERQRGGTTHLQNGHEYWHQSILSGRQENDRTRCRNDDDDDIFLRHAILGSASDAQIQRWFLRKTIKARVPRWITADDNVRKRKYDWSRSLLGPSFTCVNRRD